MKGKTSKLVMLLISFAFILLFQFIPAPAGLNQTSMQVIGIFIGIMLMWNFIGTDWPSLLCMAILAIFQIMSPGDKMCIRDRPSTAQPTSKPETASSSRTRRS